MGERGKITKIIELDRVFEGFLNPAYKYNFHQSPDVVRSKEDALRAGINCVSLAHLVLGELFDVELPSRLMCIELWGDKERFEPVEKVDDAQKGDLFWFGLKDVPKQPEDMDLIYSDDGELLNCHEFPIKHTAIFTGLYADDEPLLLHASNKEGGHNTIWPLSKFGSNRRYEKLYNITRLAIAGTKIT